LLQRQLGQPLGIAMAGFCKFDNQLGDRDRCRTLRLANPSLRNAASNAADMFEMSSGSNE
jgi:hypothetical protein